MAKVNLSSFDLQTRGRDQREFIADHLRMGTCLNCGRATLMTPNTAPASDIAAR